MNGNFGWPVQHISGMTPYICIQDQKASGTAGGGTSTGSYLTHVLNTIVVDTAGIVALASNQILLPAGTYDTQFWAVAFATGLSRARLQNITLGTTITTGTNCTTNNAINASANSHGGSRFVLAGPTVLELQQRVGTARATDGFGSAASFGDVEIYAEIQFWKVA
jgi:hypothetical protein